MQSEPKNVYALWGFALDDYKGYKVTAWAWSSDIYTLYVAFGNDVLSNNDWEFDITPTAEEVARAIDDVLRERAEEEITQ